MSDRATLVQIYIAFYNRAPDPEGLTFWQGACDAGLSLAAIADLFVPQDESIGTYPFLGNPTEEGIRSFLQSVYKNLFNRDLDGPGETFWTNQILKSLNGDPDGLTIGEVILSIITGAQGDDITTLANKTEVALDFHDQAAALDDFVQNAEATTASRLALSVVDDSDFSVVQGKVLNENYFEEFDGQGNPLFVPFEAGLFDPIVGPGQTALTEVQVNGFIDGNQLSSSVAVLADGKVVTAYTITGNGPNQVGINIRNADGTLTIPDQFLLDQAARDAGGIANSAEVVALPDGGFIVAARTFPNGAGDASVTAFRFDATGVQISDPEEIVDPDDFFIIDSFAVTYLPTGDLMYTISGNEAGSQLFGQPDDIFMTVRTLEGGVVSPLQVVNDNDGTPSTEDAPAAAALPDGTTLVTYDTSDEDVDGDESAVVGQIYSPEGEALGEPFVISTFTENEQNEPAVTALGEDRFVVVFDTFSREFDTSAPGVSAVILNRDGSVDVGEFPVNVVETSSQSGAQVAELDNGNFVVAWRTSENGGGDVRARIFEDDGTPVTGDIVVNTFTNGSQGRVDLAVGKDGFVVTWDAFAETPEDPFGFGVRMAAFDEDGVRVPLPQQANPNLPAVQAEEFQVNDEVEARQETPSVVGLPDGGGVFSYYDTASDETLFEFRGPDGLPRSGEMVAFGANSGTRDLKMFATPDGGFVMVGDAAFNAQVGGGILMQIFDAGLNPGPIMRVNQTGSPGDVERPDVTVDPDGNIIVGWEFQTGMNDPEMKLRKFDPDGSPATGEVTVVSQVVPGLEFLALAVNADGTVLALAEAVDAALGGTSGADLFVAILDEDLNTDVLKLLPIDHAGDQTAPAVTPLEDGNFLVVMDNSAGPGDPGGNDISGIIIDSDGDAVGGEFLVNTTTDFNQRTPEATVLSDGRVLVSWAGENPGFGQDIFGRVFNGDGSVATGEFLLNEQQTGNQTLPDVSAAGDGFVASWLTDPGFGGPNVADVNGAVFDSALDPVSLPRVLRDNVTTFLTQDDLLNLQDIPLDGGNFEVVGFGNQTALGAVMDLNPGNTDFVRYNPLTAFWEAGALPDGEQVTDIFTYQVRDDTNATVSLVGSVTVQAFEDLFAPP